MSTPFRIDFVGIGASKSGTTWLGHMLEGHPQICMSVPKEVHFFNDRLTYRNTILEKNYSKGLDWYKMHFNHCAPGKLKGEITPRYSTDIVVPERIKAHNKDIKILYCLRNPVDRIESHYNFAKYFVGKEDRSFDRAFAEEPEFIDMSLYYKNLSMYLKHFSRDQICIVWFEDIKERPEKVLSEVYTFLGVDPTYRPRTIYDKSNPGRISKIPKLQNVIRKLNYRLIQMGFSGLVKRLKMAGLGKWVMHINSKPLQKEKITPELKTHIIECVYDDIKQLEKWSGKDLSHWLQ